jgi:hypothetical protein
VSPVDWFVVRHLLRDRTEYPEIPTNGALMIAVAVALAPHRLVISGVDLYLHPGGKYPGLADQSNDYDAKHSRATDVFFMREALSRYRGDLTILSDALRRELSQKPS